MFYVGLALILTFSCLHFTKLSNASLSQSEQTARTQELHTFYKKLLKAVKNQLQLEASNDNPKQITDQIYKNIGSQFLSIIFNCNSPEYIGFDKKKHTMSPQSTSQLKESDQCNLSTKLWSYENDQSYTSLFNYNNNVLSNTLLKFPDLYKIMHTLNLCDDFLTLIRHPAHFYPSDFKPPVECQGQSKPMSTTTTTKNTITTTRQRIITTTPRCTEQK